MRPLSTRDEKAALRRFLSLATLCLGVGWASAAQNDAPRLKVERSRLTGLAAFVSAEGGLPIPVTPPAGRANPNPADFLREHGILFGVSDPARQLGPAMLKQDSLNFTHTSHEQVHRGVPVFSGVIRIHQDPAGRVMSANGDFYPIPDQLQTVPTIDAATATARATEALKGANPAVELSKLVIVDPAWYGGPPAGAQLAYYLILSDLPAGIREAFFVDAHTGRILDRWNLIHTARVRRIYDTAGTGSIPGTLVRSEGDAPVASPTDANRAYDYLGDTYTYYFQSFGRDAIDGTGGALIATVRFNPGNYCPNASWNGAQMLFCSGTVTDDITAHELTHGVTEYTAGLIYQYQPGQLNEAYSDIFGEMIDLFNGDAAFAGAPTGPPFWPTHPTGSGLDTPNGLRIGCSPRPAYSNGVRWLVAEDATAFGGSIRDMWSPPCLGDPDRANSTLQTCSIFDNGGVHSGSGIPNHAFAIMVDGKTFNGITVSPIGPIKAGAVWYRALAFYLTPGSDFKDAYAALNQAASDLIGTFPNDPRTGAPTTDMITAADAVEVDDALRAVEMNTDGRCGACAFNCDSTGIPPINDHCPDALVAVDGFNEFATADATTDGPAIIPAVECPPASQNVPFVDDVWYQYTATCDGGLTVSLCTPDAACGYDGTVAIYGDGSPVCACPTNNNSLIACGDDTCGVQGGPPEATAPVVAGGCYLIRIGSYDNTGEDLPGCGQFEVVCSNCSPASAAQEDPDVPDAGFGSRPRWLSFFGGDAGRNQAVRVKLVSLPAPFHVLNGQVRWVGDPTEYTEAAGFVLPSEFPGAPTFYASTLECDPVFRTDWNTFGVIHIHDLAVVPGADYDVQFLDNTCSPDREDDFSVALRVRTSRWGDVVRDCSVIPCPPPDGVANIASDTLSVLNKFGNRAGAPGKSRADVDPAAVDFKISISDVTRMLDAFRSLPYPFTTVPPPCP